MPSSPAKAAVNQVSEKYLLPCRPEVLKLSEIYAKSCIGITEQKSNSGKEINIFLETVGLQPGNPYCAAGAYWCFARACGALGYPTNDIPIYKTGSANFMFDHARRNGIRARFSARRHNLIVWRIHGKYRGHVERIISTGAAGWVTTIGFNTVSGKAGSTTEGVFIRKRNIFHPLGRMFVRGIIGFYDPAGKKTEEL